jgi:hypothetical protein
MFLVPHSLVLTQPRTGRSYLQVNILSLVLTSTQETENWAILLTAKSPMCMLTISLANQDSNLHLFTLKYILFNP